MAKRYREEFFSGRLVFISYFVALLINIIEVYITETEREIRLLQGPINFLRIKCLKVQRLCKAYFKFKISIAKGLITILALALSNNKLIPILSKFYGDVHTIFS